ncbi:MAG: stage III sporulation protein AE [Firmicutes bacterium]|jgi:stage III sporulation protein AE|uniref:Stage III sporulation protein AE n=1 Tax=Sulfobacillus benefaciens TaxID=453960 RepID=A0A2T2XBM8_9FIRM|nr:stage III sporulation protein AE [Bacillota bacterium]MCL5014779.1 stage III sporulation protein AE [Bacillota bacterium]PSR31899.1 MAG: stage III sporulation protein AE [Sulfobacillus benefaciens]
MRKGFWVVILAVGMIAFLSPFVSAQSIDTLVQRQAQSVNTQSLDRQVSQLVNPYPQIHVPTVSEIVSDLLHHKNPFPLNQLFSAMAQAIGGDLAQEGRVLGVIFLLSVLAAILSRLSESIDASGHIAELAQMAVVSALILIALHSFGVALSMVHNLLTDVVHLMESLIPLLVVLMAGSGAVASAGIFHPIMMLTVNLVAVLTRSWVLPLVLLATIIDLVGHWMPNFSIKNLALLLRQTGLTLLGGLMTLFLGVMAVEGSAGSVADGVTLRTGKFLANTFVPVVGKAFSDAMEAVLGSSMLLKNAVSVVGALTIIVLVAFPLIKLFIMMVLYRLGAAATEPLGVSGVNKTLETMATAAGWLLAITGSVALMFFLMITVVVTASNGAGL